MPGRKNTTTSVKEGVRGNVKANLVGWPLGCLSTATMSVRHGLPGIMTENMVNLFFFFFFLGFKEGGSSGVEYICESCRRKTSVL